MNEIIIPAIAMGALGLALGLLLAFASKIFAIKVDERVTLVTEALPGANCGSCGFAGCGTYANSIVNEGAKINCCSPGGQKVADTIAQIMGVSKEAVDEKRAIVLCAGTKDNALDKYNYVGENSCIAVSKLPGGGQKSCEFGCLGLGTCATVCSHDAISIVNNIAVVDGDKCGGCGECANVCPKNIITIVSKKNKIIVKCKSCDRGAVVKEKCIAGCIGCKICEKNCPAGAITVTNNCASIDYEKCTQCGLCVEKCPKNIIKSE